MHCRLIWLVVLGCLTTPACLVCAETADHLVINEIYVRLEKGGGAWIEAFNPTTDTLFLAAIWAEGLKTCNNLPLEIKQRGGAAVPPKGWLVVCSSQAEDVETFRREWQIPPDVEIIPEGFGCGGWGLVVIHGVTDRAFGVYGEWSKHSTTDDLWIGPRTGTSPNEAGLECEGPGLLAVAENTWIYSRVCDDQDTNNSADFTHTTPTPGRSNSTSSGASTNTWGQVKARN